MPDVAGLILSSDSSLDYHIATVLILATVLKYL